MGVGANDGVLLVSTGFSFATDNAAAFNDPPIIQYKQRLPPPNDMNCTFSGWLASMQVGYRRFVTGAPAARLRALPHHL